jgi:hypothetical protein
MSGWTRVRSGCVGLAIVCTACNQDWKEWKDRVSLSRYSDRTQVVEAGAIAKGWIPEFLPRTATNILEWHNVETDRTRVEFSFDVKTDRDWLDRFFRPVAGSGAKSLKRELLRSRGATINEDGNLQFYQHSEMERDQGYLAINNDQGRAQYWTRPK